LISRASSTSSLTKVASVSPANTGSIVCAQG
jgi:hypothetical protein